MKNLQQEKVSGFVLFTSFWLFIMLYILGFNGACSVHEWYGTFQNVSCMFKMTSVCGHVMGVDFISKYNNWDRVDPVELFSCPIEKKEATPKLKMPAFLAAEARGCDYLVLWLDCDKEGENICFEVMNAVSTSIKGNVYSNSVTYRAKFSAITQKDIKEAFNNLCRFFQSRKLNFEICIMHIRFYYNQRFQLIRMKMRQEVLMLGRNLI